MVDRRVDYRMAVFYSMGSIGAGLFYAFNNFVLPLYLSFFTRDAILIGWLSSTRSIEQSIIQPVVGAASDRTWTRLGRRTPFFLLAMPGVAVLAIASARIPHGAPSLPVVVLVIFVFSLLFNIGIDPYTALMADITGVPERGRVSSVSALLGFVGQVAILGAGVALWSQHPDWVFDLMAVGLVIGFGITAFGIRERRESFAPTERIKWRQYLRSVFQNREAVKYLFVQFLYGFGVNAATPFITLFAVNEIGVPDDMALALAAVLLIATAIFAVPAGVLGDRWGRKKVYAAGLVILGASALVGAFCQTIPQFFAILIVIGVGNAAGSVLWYPILTELVPSNRIGEFTGIATIFQTGAIFLSVLVAGALIDWNVAGLHYRSIFVLTAIFVLMSVAFLQAVRLPVAQESIAPIGAAEA